MTSTNALLISEIWHRCYHRGGIEAQALFTTNPVALAQPNDFIRLTVVFTNESGLSRPVRLALVVDADRSRPLLTARSAITLLWPKTGAQTGRDTGEILVLQTRSPPES